MIFVAELAAVKDLGLVNVQFIDGIPVREIPDRFEPLLQSASIDYATGLLTLLFNETVDVTPQNVVNFSYLVEETVSAFQPCRNPSRKAYIDIYCSEP